MTASAARRRHARGMRAWGAATLRAWTSSLRFRTTAIAAIASAVALIVVFLVMSLLIQSNLFNSRLHQVEADAQRAVAEAQSRLDSADVGGDPARMASLIFEVRDLVSRLSATDSAAMLKPSDTPLATNAAQPWRTSTFPEQVVSPLMRDHVQKDATQQWVQSVALPDADGRRVPGVLIGQQITVPEAGVYELYLAYDLVEAQQTLTFVQGTLWLTGLALLALIGLITWLVVRQVTAPVEQAAHTAEQLAQGDLGLRLDVRGEDEIATLATSFNAMADSLQGRIEELAELSLVQQRFVSDVSHELRTPLTTIKLASEMLNASKDDFDPTAARSAELLHTQVGRFETLLTDLLEISRYDAGSVQLDMEATSLSALAEDVVGQMQPLAEQHGSDIRLVAPGGYSPVDMDPRRVRRIVRNLVGNAIEHGEGKPIVVTVDSDQRAVAIGVRDYGVGMREQDMSRVFDRFWRADPSRKRTIGGTGLGLSIALGDAKLHHGHLEVWSKPGEGTNFVLTLPRTGSVLAEESPVPLEPDDSVGVESMASTQPVPVIVVDDVDDVDDVDAGDAAAAEPDAQPDDARRDEHAQPDDAHRDRNAAQAPSADLTAADLESATIAYSDLRVTETVTLPGATGATGATDAIGTTDAGEADGNGEEAR